MASAILRRILRPHDEPAEKSPVSPPGPKAAASDPATQDASPKDPAKNPPAAEDPAAGADVRADAAANGVPEEVRELREVCAELDEKVTRFLEEETEDEVLRGVQRRVRESVDIIAEALQRYTYVPPLPPSPIPARPKTSLACRTETRTLTPPPRPEQLSLSYNGGKDCLVLLILLLATLNRHLPTTATASFPRTLQCIYIVPPHPFPEVDTFVAHSSNAYSLTLTRSPLAMRAALSAYLSTNPSLRAVFVGTRRTDPHGSSLSPFDETDGDWPRFMRVHPVLEWHYAEIWAFIRKLGIDYCGLYDQGYTSLGGTTDTLPNPALREGGGSGFRPAYELESDGEERLGRD